MIYIKSPLGLTPFVEKSNTHFYKVRSTDTYIVKSFRKAATVTVLRTLTKRFFVFSINGVSPNGLFM